MRNHNPRVGGSSPSSATNIFLSFLIVDSRRNAVLPHHCHTQGVLLITSNNSSIETRSSYFGCQRRAAEFAIEPVFSKQHREGGLDKTLENLQPARTDSAVDDTMVA